MLPQVLIKCMNSMHGHGVDQVKKHANQSNTLDTFSTTGNTTISSEPETETTRIGSRYTFE
jgi:hypothetical protein